MERWTKTEMPRRDWTQGVYRGKGRSDSRLNGCVLCGDPTGDLVISSCRRVLLFLVFSLTPLFTMSFNIDALRSVLTDPVRTIASSNACTAAATQVDNAARHVALQMNTR